MSLTNRTAILEEWSKAVEKDIRALRDTHKALAERLERVENKPASGTSGVKQPVRQEELYFGFTGEVYFTVWTDLPVSVIENISGVTDILSGCGRDLRVCVDPRYRIEDVKDAIRALAKAKDLPPVSTPAFVDAAVYEPKRVGMYITGINCPHCGKAIPTMVQKIYCSCPSCGWWLVRKDETLYAGKYITDLQGIG